jgi:hypothetical protein
VGLGYHARLFAIHFSVVISGDVGSSEISDMHRDEAIKLLKCGPDGTAEWDERRESGEGIPDLS